MGCLRHGMGMCVLAQPSSGMGSDATEKNAKLARLLQGRNRTSVNEKADTQ
jgi:hypothetical protein